MVQSSSSVQRSSTSCLLLYLLAWIATSTSVCSFHASTGVSPCQEQGRPPVYTFDELRAISLKIPISVGKSLSTTTTSRARRIGIHSALSAASNSDTSSKYYSARKIASRKSQLLWISQSVQKIQAKERIVLDRHPSNATTTLQSTFSVSRSNTALDTLTQSRVVDSQLAVGDCHTNFNTQLVQALELLSSARTAHQVLEAGRLLDVPRICQCQPVAVLERVAKATAMTGLLHISLAIVEHMLQLEVRPVSSSSTATTQQHAHPAHLPSIICQDAICNALRQAGRINRLEQLLCQMGSVANRQNSTSQQISLAAFNTYLAALCNIATRKDATASQQQQLQQGGPDSSAFGFDASVTASLALSTVDALDRAWYWIRDPVKTKGTMAVTPDKVSFATVIQAAAAIGNETLVNAIWKELRNQTVSPNIVAYNARLRSMISADTYRSAKRFDNLHDLRTEHKKRDLEILSVWDEEISRDISVQADKYTIDLLLLPLIRCGRIGDVESLLDTFVKRHSEKVVSNSFTAFLITVVDGGELASARALFETYILPTLSPVMVGDAGAMIRMVRPMTRHFNVLLEGYRKQAHCTGFEDSNVSCDINHQQSSAQEAYVLYRMMTQAWGTRPDAFTITSMMGLCQSSTELSNLLVEAISEFNVECSSIFLRAARKYFS